METEQRRPLNAVETLTLPSHNMPAQNVCDTRSAGVNEFIKMRIDLSMREFLRQRVAGPQYMYPQSHLSGVRWLEAQKLRCELSFQLSSFLDYQWTRDWHLPLKLIQWGFRD
jgi:hypothetical protein